MPIVEMPNGDQVNFPDDMPKEQIRSMIASKFPELEQQASQPLQDHEKMSASENFVGQGMLMGFGDELTAAIGTPGRMVKQYMNDQPVSMSQAYEDGHDFEQERIRQYKEDSPIASTASEIGGSMFGAGNLMKGGVSLLAKNPTVLKAAAEGGIYGGIYGAGTADRGDRTEGAAIGVGTGAAFGGLAQGGANAIKSKLANNAAQKAAPTVEAMKIKANDLYTKMRKSGFKFKESKVNHLKGNVNLALGETTEGLAPKAHELKKMVERDLVGDVDIQDMHNLSKAVNRISRSKLEGDDKFYVGRIKDMVDAAFDETKATDYKGPLSALPMKKEADQLWKTQRKTELIENAMEQAQDAASGFENGIVIEFRKIKRNKKLFNQFDAAEKQMINGVIRRMSPQQILRAGRYLSPTSPLGLILFGGTNLAGNPVLAAGIGGIGMAAKKANQILTKAKADAVHQAIATQSAPIQSVSKSARYSIPTLAQQSTNQTMSANSNKRYQPNPQLKRRQR